ncbi:unnamed protein product, partial [Brenthis ino]
MKKIILIILSVQQIIVTTPAVRPGKFISYSLPDKRPLKKALGYIEDTYLNFTELSNKYGYSIEEHIITTDDEYLLTVFRILSKCDQVLKYPVILMHGISDTSDTWILTGPKSGLGYILSNNCYDVWAGNLRGNTYSRKHKRLNPDVDPEYWEFSFDENGFYDLPAIIDYIINATKQTKVYYVGHSQGTTDFFVMGSLRPEYNKKVQLSIHLAPVAWMSTLKSPIPILLARATKLLKEFLDNLGFAEILGKHQVFHAIVELLCQFAPDAICGTFFALTTGYSQGSISSRNLAVSMGHILAGVSVKTVAHFGQLIMSGNFQRYDEEKEGNIRRYGTPTPSKYNVSLITSPVVLVCGQNDWLSTSEDIQILASQLPNLVEKYIVPEPKGSHNNHLWGNDVKESTYSKVLDYFKKFST